MMEYKIAVIPGDGIGKEVMPEGTKALRTVENLFGEFSLRIDNFPWGVDYFHKHGHMMPANGLDILKDYDAIYLGAIGSPQTVPDHITLWEIVLPIRKTFEQSVNVRPVRLLPGLIGPLRNKEPKHIDFVIVRENLEGEYSGVGGRIHRGTADEVAIQTSIFTRKASERVIRYSFDLSKTRRKKVTNVTKSNALQYSMVFWDEIFLEIASDYPDVQIEKWHVDAMAARFITHPETLDVVVGSNLFADILSDLGGAMQGSLGMCPSGNLNLEKQWPSMFEPIHGSAPDIAGKGIANPIGMIWSGALMLEFLGEEKAAQFIIKAIEKTVFEGKVLPPDLGGSARTNSVGDEIRSQIYALGVESY
jgi:tartrate dehydrogenase/decarboxylase/D-malate dehydrogenase